MKRLFSLICIALFALATPGQSETVDSVYVAFWNVENLFDNIDDPYDGDDEFTATSEKKWTDARVHDKYMGLSRVLGAMNGGEGPDILGLAEVEHRSVIETWASDYLQNFDYGIAYHESPDLRSIDLALLYRKSKFKHVGTTGHPVHLGQQYRPTRDVTVYTLAAGQDTLDCILVHWPSRWGGTKESEPKRIVAAKVTAQVVDSLYAIRKNDDILVMGDFNDTPANISVTQYLHTRDIPPSQAKVRDFPYLFNSMIPVHEDENRGTYYYRGDWNTIDQILLAAGLFDRVGFGTDNPGGNVFVLPFMREQEGRYKDAPYRTYVGPRYLGGISDHFPVFIQLNHYHGTRE